MLVFILACNPRYVVLKITRHCQKPVEFAYPSKLPLHYLSSIYYGRGYCEVLYAPNNRCTVRNVLFHFHGILFLHKNGC